MKNYEQYSSKGLPWCNSFPAHWGLCRAKYMYRKENRPVNDDDEVVTCFRDGIVTLRKNRRLTGFTEAVQETGYQGIRKGDLVIHVMDAFAGAIGVSDSDGRVRQYIAFAHHWGTIITIIMRISSERWPSEDSYNRCIEVFGKDRRILGSMFLVNSIAVSTEK